MTKVGDHVILNAGREEAYFDVVCSSFASGEIAIPWHHVLYLQHIEGNNHQDTLIIGLSFGALTINGRWLGLVHSELCKHAVSEIGPGTDVAWAIDQQVPHIETVTMNFKL